MQRVLNIEVLRVKKMRRTAVLTAVCSVLLAFFVATMPLTQATFISSDDARHVFIFDEKVDVQISMTETWNPSDGLDVIPGKTLVKQPLIKNEKGPIYMRGIIKINDNSGMTLTPAQDSERINLIMGTLFSDEHGLINVNSSYSATKVKSLTGVKDIYSMSIFSAPQWNESMQAFVLEYNGIMEEGKSVTLFDKVVIPIDYSTSDITLMGDYTITVWAQAIQTAGFADQSSAMRALSNANM
jgi:hypothetical protein